MSALKPATKSHNGSDKKVESVAVMSAAAKYSRLALAGGICASSTHLVTVPMDVVKTRLQVANDATRDSCC
jgi:hypothetical protein